MRMSAQSLHPPSVAPASQLGKTGFLGYVYASYRKRGRRNMWQCSYCVGQEIHVTSADLAGLAFAILLIENASLTSRSVVYIWDRRLQRTGLRKRRSTFRLHGADNVGQVGREIPITVHV